MSSLPIAISAPATSSAPAAPSSNTPDTGSSASDAAPFGNVLARQISDAQPQAAQDTGKAGEKLSTDALVQSGDVAQTPLSGNSKKASATAPNPALPTDMLAALLPQGMNSVVSVAPNTSTPRAGLTAIPDSSVASAMNTNAAALIRANTGSNSGTGNPGANSAANAPNASSIDPGVAKTDSAPAGATPGFGSTLASSLNAASAQSNSAAQVAPAPATTDTAALAAQQGTLAATTPVAQAVQMTVNAPVAQASKWQDEFSQKITWLASSGKDQTAELHLNPPQLGPVDVVIKVSGDQATALFTSPHAAVREVIEQSMPRLREMMSGSGITLGNTTVSDQTPRDQGQSGAPAPAYVASSTPSEPPQAIRSTPRVSQISRHNGIVDTFA